MAPILIATQCTTLSQSMHIWNTLHQSRFPEGTGALSLLPKSADEKGRRAEDVQSTASIRILTTDQLKTFTTKRPLSF